MIVAALGEFCVPYFACGCFKILPSALSFALIRHSSNRQHLVQAKKAEQKTVSINLDNAYRQDARPSHLGLVVQ